MNNQAPNTADSDGKHAHLKMRVTGLTKAVDHLEPGEREFCLAAISEWLDAWNERGNLLDYWFEAHNKLTAIIADLNTRLREAEKQLAASRGEE